MHEKFNSDPTVYAMCFNRPERRDEQEDHQNALNEWDKTSKTDPCEDLALPEK